ncbi:Proline-rich basic protein 1 [Channa argus]|uniref:Proline-rich basic protein 1 n=1 Tax=Channa argus TaxID=215402 RepID=A0A6G1PU22_CHAAH|nr:Proline-rich basic protein 1 [Channa argus]
MDSWTLQGDSYSFLRSAPRTFTLCHRDGTPNHVEIFDIINSPTQRSAISETTCLCDIFGDDHESPSLSSSPAVEAFVPLQRELDGAAAALPLVDDLNESSGSYHTAQGSSEGEEGFEDSTERLCSPLLQNESSERRKSESEGLSTGHPDISQDISSNLEPNRKSPVPELHKIRATSEVFSTGERTPSPGHKSPFTLSSDGRVSSLSSSSIEKTYSPSPNLREVNSDDKKVKIIPTFIERLNSPSNKCLPPSPSSESRDCVSLSSPDSLNTKFSTEFIVPKVLPEQRSSFYNQQSRSSLPPTPNKVSEDVTESAFESRAIASSPLPPSSSAELLSQSRETLLFPELKNRPDTPDTQTSSPFPELGGRVSLPELFSIGSTPETLDTPCTPELISEPSPAESDTTTTPENQSARLLAEPVSGVSTPAPRYTPPSPVIPIATSAELEESVSLQEVRHTTPSPVLSFLSPCKTGTRTPSPEIRHISTPPEIRTQLSSPVIAGSLPPSPEVSCSPTESRHTAPSPEIKVTGLLQEVSRKEPASEVEITSASPLLESTLASLRSLNSSPHITGICYTVVQPEDRKDPPFPELFHLSTLEPQRTLASPEASSPTPSRDSIQSNTADSTDASRESPHIIGFTSCVLKPETTLSHHPRYQTPSPQPKHHGPSPELRYINPSPEKNQSPSPQQRSTNLSPIVQSPEQWYYQHSPATVSTDYHLQYTQTSPLLSSASEVERGSSVVGITEIHYPTHLEKNVSHSFEEEDIRVSSKVAEIQTSSPVHAVQSPVSTSPFLSEVEAGSSLKPQSPARKVTHLEGQDKSSLTLFSEEKQERGPTCFQKDTCSVPLFDVKCPSPNLLASKENNTNISPLSRATFSSPVQGQENLQPQLATYSIKSKSKSSLKSTCTPKHLRRQLNPKVRSENRDRFSDNMAHHVNRRRTPSPPLTRLTPVHIIAPEKPYRRWQSRSHNPSQVIATSGNLKKMTNKESPCASVDNNSQDQCIRLGRQSEIEKEIQPEGEREGGRERQKREEQVPEKGEGWQGDTRYRGEQLELSFNARNRKGPGSSDTAPTSRETRQGLPTVHSYSESLLATRQLQQQQRLLRLPSQQETRGGCPSRRLQPPAAQNKKSATGRVVASRPSQSSSSSMGSELDEADNEVKWFTDLAFHSLSSPELDYLDMYNSSHHSSANISQPSTQESPAGLSASWPTYADFRGSAPNMDNNELTFQQSAHNSGGLDPGRRYEMGSFECVDVAVEREDSRKVRRGVPKRQIQLKRKHNTEGKQDESSENSSPGVPMMLDSPCLESQVRETFIRQHSTPAAIQECYPSGSSPEPNQQNERKLQKSISLDETCSKTKMATCLIKSVLSKKMQSVDKQQDDQAEGVSPACEENNLPTESVESSKNESPKPAAHHPRSSLQSNCCISSQGLPVRGELRTEDGAKAQKSRPSSSSSSRSVSFSQGDTEEADFQNRNPTSLRSEMRSQLKVPFDKRKSRTGVQEAEDYKTRVEKQDDDLTTATLGGSSVTEAMQQIINKEQDCENTEDHKQLQPIGNMPKTQEITLRAVEKKTSSINVCLTPEAENKPEASSPDMSLGEKKESTGTSVDEKMGEEEGNGNTAVKGPIHKVRDVRRLVKNTYNLSFKAASSVLSSDVNEERIENFSEKRREDIKEERQEEVLAGKEQELGQEMWRKESKENTEKDLRVKMKDEQKQEAQDLPPSPPYQSKGKSQSHPQPMQIEYKAVCWKEHKNKMSCSGKDSVNPDDKPQASPNLSPALSRESKMSSNANVPNHTTLDTVNTKPYQHDLKMELDTRETPTHKQPVNEDKSLLVRTERKPPMLGSLPKLPSKEREVSTAVVLIRDGSSKTKISSSHPQEEITTPLCALASSPSPGPITPRSTPGSSGHSVSMLLKEKGFHADIGAVMSDSQNAAGRTEVPHKHVNCLEIPLQIPLPSDEGQIDSHRERSFSSSSSMSARSLVSENTDTPTKTREDEALSSKPAIKDTVPPLKNMHEQTAPLTKHKELGDFEAVKRLDPTFPPRSPAIRRFRPQPIEVKSLSNETQKEELPATSTGNNRPQAIEVKSIAKNSQKPVVPPKPSCKFKPADFGAMPNEGQKPQGALSIKPQGEERPQTIVVSSPTIYRKISNESVSSSNYTRKLAVSAISSLKPPPGKTTATTISSLSNQSMSPSAVSTDRGQQQQTAASPQNSRYKQRPTSLSVVPTAVSCPGAEVESAPGPVSDPTVQQVPGPVSASANQPSQSAVMDPDHEPLYPKTAYPQEPTIRVTSNNSKQPPAVSTTQMPRYTNQPCRRLHSGECSQRTGDLNFYASDDPPSYDERESFSPLILPDLTHRRSNRFQPSSCPHPCSCTAGCPSHPGLAPPHHHHSPHNLTPPAPPHSPGQTLAYPMAQPPLRPHHCRPDHQPISYQPGSPKSSPLGLSHPQALYQTLHQPPHCPPHPSLIQVCPSERPLQPPQHIEPRRPPPHRSPQQQQPAMVGAPYRDPGHSHSPGLSPMDTQYLCGPSNLGPSFGSEYGGDNTSLYSESSYGQTPRRVLMDPETGKYFYIEVPVQPLRKMLFDPETGQYVEVLIPQQAMSHSGLYPPSAAPYPSLHNPSMYATAPQYMPYAAPPPQAHHQVQPQPPRYPEAPAPATMHPSGSGVSYRNPSGQGSKPDTQNHPTLDQSYLESMYYVPTGMNASPNPNPPDYYHKRPPNLPPTGGKRS